MNLRNLRVATALAAFIGMVTPLHQAAAAQPTVKYDITPELVGGKLTGLRVRLELTVKPGRMFVLQIPDGLRSHLAPSGFAIEGGTLQPGTTDKALPVKAFASHITVTYRLLSDGSESLKARGQGIGIHANWFVLRGDEGLLMPEGRQHEPATVHVTPGSGWTQASSLNGPASLERVADSQFLGGTNYRIATRNVDGVSFRLAYPEAMNDRAEALLADTSTILTTEQRFWATPPQSAFIGLVELSDESEISGRGMQGGFSLYLGKSANQKSVQRLIAHENLHGWISRAIGGFPKTDDDLEAWLNEGFTEAYTARLLLSSGLWTTQDYIDDWNLSLARYGTSPVKTEPNSRILTDRNRNFDVNRLPYDRGRLLAVTWDRAFREKTNGRLGLVDVLRDQMQVATQNSRTGRVVSADKLFPIVAKRVTSLDLSDSLARYVDRGDPITLDSGLFGTCVIVESVTQPVFDRGFDFEATLRARGKVTGLERGGPAERAGLKEGDKVRIDEVPTNDSRVTLSYRVDDGSGRSHTVSYRPEGSSTVTFQQLRMRGGDLTVCSDNWP